MSEQHETHGDAQDERAEEPFDRRLQEQGEAGREHPEAERAGERPERRRRGPDRIQLLQPGDRAHLAPFGPTGQLVDLADLVEPEDARHHRAQLDVRAGGPARLDEQHGGQGDDVDVLGAGAAGHALELVLDHVDGFAREDQRPAEEHEEAHERPGLVVVVPPSTASTACSVGPAPRRGTAIGSGPWAPVRSTAR